MNNDWEKILEDFMDEGDWVKAPGLENEGPYSCYLWEDWDAAKEFHGDNPEAFVYTLIEAEGSMYLLKGARLVNRFAYLFSRKEVLMPDGTDEVLWWPEEEDEEDEETE